MFSPRRLLPDLDRPGGLDAWIALVRAVAVPFVVLEVVVERGNYPPGDERWAWVLAVALAAGALFFGRYRSLRAPALVFDWALISCWVALYSFEPGTPVRQLLVLAVMEAALRYELRGAGLSALASIPALAFFEWRQASLDLHPFDIGHVVGPAGVLLLVGIVVGVLAGRLPERPAGR
jgi:hypothetical protein